ncbi:MAG: DUF6291 domain-containing protein [Bacteroidales bacterium]|nr:DUF6291 domain-containing protein [Bacteroidales bacterium]
MEEKQNSDTFVFYPTFLNSIEAIRDTEMRLALFEAVSRYGVFGTPPDFTAIDESGLLEGMFLQIRFAIDEAKAKRLKSRNNGKKGGAPKGNKNACKNNQIQAKTTKNKPNVNVNDNVNDNVNISSNEDRGQIDKRFSPPSLSDINEFCLDNGFDVDANAIFDYYTANGWVQGRNKPIKDWKAAVRQWVRREGEFVKNARRASTQNSDKRHSTEVTATSWQDYKTTF